MLQLEDLWEADDWQDLPDDDGEAFARLVALAEPRFRKRIEEIQDESEKERISYKYMNILMGVAKERAVKPFINQEMPYRRNFNEDLFEDFESDLTMHLSRMQAKKAKRSAANMVTLSGRHSASIQRAVLTLKEKIEQMNMEPWRKKRLLSKLDELIDALKKRRIDLGSVAALAATLIALPGGAHATLEVFGVDIHKDILAPIAEARAEQEKEEWQAKLLLPPQPKMISAQPSARIRLATPPKPAR